MLLTIYDMWMDLWPKIKKKIEDMGIPKPLWSSEAPRRILFKTPPPYPDLLKGNISGKDGEWGEEVRNYIS